MRSLIVISTAIMFGIVNVPALPAFADGTTSPGKNSVFVSHQGLDPCCGVTLSGTIVKGKKGYVLALQATFARVATFECTPTDIDIFPPTVNEVFMEPDGSGGYISAGETCPAGQFCSTNGTYWLDLDAAEAANPGLFIGKPLNITLEGRWFGASCSMFTSATMSAQLVKK